MSSALLAAVRSAHDNLPTIVDALMQYLLERGNSIVEWLSGQQHVFHATTANVPQRNPLLLVLSSGPAKAILIEKIWQILDYCLNFSLINDATVTAILRVLVVKNSPPPRMHSRKSLQRMHTQVLQEWARLQVGRLQRGALLNEHCPLIAPLAASVDLRVR
jgi:hypothetical protein